MRSAPLGREGERRGGERGRGEGEEGRVRGGEGEGRESEGRRETIITTATLKMQYRVVVICTQIAALVQCG